MQDDLIRRQVVKEQMLKYGFHAPDMTVTEFVEDLPPVNPQPCEDAISRQSVLNALYALCDTGETLKENPWRDNPHIDAVVETIEELPAVTSQPKTGEWIIIDDCEQFIAKCSECGRIEDSRMISKYPYCHCGAKMSES